MSTIYPALIPILNRYCTIELSFVAALLRRVPGSKKATAETVSPHWLRHAQASHAMDRGTPVHLVKETLVTPTLLQLGAIFMRDQQIVLACIINLWAATELVHEREVKH